MSEWSTSAVSNLPLLSQHTTANEVPQHRKVRLYNRNEEDDMKDVTAQFNTRIHTIQYVCKSSFLIITYSHTHKHKTQQLNLSYPLLAEDKDKCPTCSPTHKSL